MKVAPEPTARCRRVTFSLQQLRRKRKGESRIFFETALVRRSARVAAMGRWVPGRRGRMSLRQVLSCQSGHPGSTLRQTHDPDHVATLLPPSCGAPLSVPWATCGSPGTIASGRGAPHRLSLQG